MMYIIYNKNNQVCLISPVGDLIEQYGIETLADKDVPAGLMYKFVSHEEIQHVLHVPQEHWVIDINDENKDGVGLNSEQFSLKYPEIKGWNIQ